MQLEQLSRRFTLTYTDAAGLVVLMGDDLRSFAATLLL